MNVTSKDNSPVSYFAAANGYDGFRSYFGEVFDPESFLDIYILKGGPGTGKSSLMKKCANTLSTKVKSYELIYCSSDPKSLDGVIISTDKGRVAILDGTAPHATDPKIPGAVDKIINLGDYWNEELLKSNREEIEKLTKMKSRAYKMAYGYLSICGRLNSEVKRIIDGLYVGGNEKALELLDNRNEGSGEKKTRLITSYGKGGFHRLNTLKNISDNTVYVVGAYGSEYKFMAEIKRELDCRNIDYVLCPSPLEKDAIDAIYLPSSKKAIITDYGGALSGEEVIDTSRLLDGRGLTENRGRLESLWHEREVMLWSAADEFARASDHHFALEKIYSTAMDFAEIDKLFDETVKRIAKTLGITL